MNLQRREEIREISALLRMMPLNEAANAIDELLAHIDKLEQRLAERVIADGSRGSTPDYTGEGSAWVPPKCQPIPTSGQREKDIWNDGFAHGWRAGLDSDERKLVEAPAVVVPELTDEDLNGYSMDCDERDAVEFGYNLAASRIIPAGRVVIPPLTGEEIEARLLRLFPDISEDDPLRESCFKDSRWAYNLAVSRARAIPADRVLGEGMLSIHPDVINSISDTLRDIGDTAHNASTGPAVPDVLWDIREKAYEAYIVATDAEAEIVQTANAQDALSALRANQGGSGNARV